MRLSIFAFITASIVMTGCGNSTRPQTPNATTAGGSPSQPNATDPNAGLPPSGNSGSPNTTLDPSHPYAFVGRFNLADPSGPAYGHCAWPGSAIGAVFTGTRISAQISDTGAPDNGNQVYNWFDASVDGQPPVVLTLAAGVTDYPIASNLPPGQHTVWLRKRTEAWIGNTRFIGFKTDGQLIGAPAASERRIEVIGASTECGYGDTESLPAGGCAFTVGTENANLAYPAVMAADLHADYANISYSGKGVYQNIYPEQSSITMPQLYGLIDPSDPSSQWDFKWIPQVVVIDMGGNDFEAFTNNGQSLSPPPEQGFVNAYASFLKTIRGHYPQALIWCVVGPTDIGDVRTGMQMDIGAAISQVGDSNIMLYSFPAYTGPTYGCDNHPDAALHTAMAHALEQEIHAKLGW